MVNFSYYTKFLILSIVLGSYSSCNYQEIEKLNSVKTVPDARFKKTERTPDHKKGIEHMAEYLQNIMKPIGANKISYESGYQLKELQKLKANGFIAKKASSILDVSERGPVNVPGRIRGIQIAPDNKDKWYAGTVGGGLWVTKDAGASWKSLTDFKIPSFATSTVAVSKTQPGKIYVGTGEPFGNLDRIGGIGIVKTLNDGKNWTYIENTKTFGDIGRMIINPTNDDHLVVASASGIHYTLDGGKSWFNPYYNRDGGLNVQDIVANPDDFNIMYGGVQNVGIVKSTDAGLSWNLIFDKKDYNPLHNRFELDVSPANTEKLLVSVHTPFTAKQDSIPAKGATTAINTDYYISGDAGKTFTLLGFDGKPEDGNLVTGQGWYDNVITAHPIDENIFYAGGVAVFKVNITDSLKYEVTPIASGYDDKTINSEVHVDQHNLVWQKGDNDTFRLILANDGGIYSTRYSKEPGIVEGDWSGIAIGLNNTQFYGADKRNGTDNYTAGAQDNGSWIYTNAGTADETSAYSRFWGGDGFEVIWNYNDPTKFIGGSQFNNFARAVDSNIIYSPHGESGGANSPFYSKITNANNNPDVVFSPSKSGVWRSTNFAANWELSTLPSNFSNGGTSSSLDVEVSVANPDVVWAGAAMSENGFWTIFVSEDNGVTFNPTTTFNDPRANNVVVHNYFISGIEASPTEEKRAYVLFSSNNVAKVLKTEDLGQTWSDISGFSEGIDRGFPNVAIHSLIEMPYDKNILWVGTDIGVIQTTDGGQTWKLLDEIPNVSVWQMKIVNDQVVMATHGRGIWTATLEELKGYEPVTYFAPPSIESLVQEGIDNQNAIVTYTQKNEATDKVTVYVDGVQIDEITDNVAVDSTYTYVFENLSEGLHTVGLKASTPAGKSSIVSDREIHIIDFSVPEGLLSINVFQPEDVYTFDDEFVIDDIDGTTGQPVLSNEDHPYDDARVYRTVLKQPIKVSEKNRMFTYEDVAIVESDTIAGKFYDFVVVEAASDLSDWKLLDIYDARRFSEWNDVYTANKKDATITDALFREQSLDLLKFFKEGDVIAFRFRLISDANTNSFGWAIRNINKDEVLTVPEVVATNKFLVYPTVSNGELNIISGTNLKNSDIEVFGLNGQRWYADKVTLSADASYPISLGTLDPGMYLVRVSVNNSKGQMQRIIIK